MAKKKKDPFDVTLTDEQKQDLIVVLRDAIRGEEAARDLLIGDGGDFDYYWTLYEQGSTRIGSDRPWPNAADLTSYLATQYVDAYCARIAKTVFVEPIWTVEGWGEAASRAPVVEEFHQWKAEEERLQGWVSKAFRPAFIEGVGVLEVSERGVANPARRQRVTTAVKLELGPDQVPILDAKDGQAVLATDPSTGEFAPAEPQDAQALMVVDQLQKIPGGPQYRVLNLKDFLILPGHARDKSEVWGYAKRFWRRVGELREQAKAKYYDPEAIEQLGETNDRQQTPADVRAGQGITSQREELAQKELWEVVFLRDFDGKGERWYVATLSAITGVLLRVKHDELGDQRFCLFTPFPRSDSLYGYSFVAKILTIIEEHTSVRNQQVDRGTLANSKPIKRLQGALWDPQEQPFGPGQVIDVRDMRELEEMIIADVPQSLITREQMILGAAERVTGMNDVASGTAPQQDRTLGEVQMVTQQSFVRIDEVTRNIQETMEELFLIRQALYVRAARSQPNGIPAPQSVIGAMQTRGVENFPGNFTAELLEGQFRGKPRGSVETSDLIGLRQDFNGFLAMAGKLFPEIFQDPEAKKSILEQALRMYRYPDRQTILGVFDRMRQAQEAAAQQAAMQPPAPPQNPINQVMGQMPQPGQMPPQGMAPQPQAQPPMMGRPQ